jgi:hypothetical protein
MMGTNLIKLTYQQTLVMPEPLSLNRDDPLASAGYGSGYIPEHDGGWSKRGTDTPGLKL